MKISEDVAPWKILAFGILVNLLGALVVVYFNWADWLSPREGLTTIQMGIHHVLIRVVFTIAWLVPTLLLSLAVFGRKFTFSPLPGNTPMRRLVNRHPNLGVAIMVVLYNEIMLWMIPDMIKTLL